MTLRDWIGSIAILEVILICVAIKTGWRWHHAELVRRFLRALRTHWKRVLIGAAGGWLLASVLGIALIILTYELLGEYRSFYGSSFEESLTDYIAIVFPLTGIGLGALLGYSTRKEPATE